MNRNRIRSLCRLFALLLFALPLLTLGWTARAGGVHDVPLTSIPPARSPIVVDGSLADWPDTHAVVFTPLDPGLSKADSPAEAAALATLRRHPAGASLQACYDAQALYVGVTWRDAAAGVGVLALHVQTDRIVHVRVAPSGRLEERQGETAGWHGLGLGAKWAVKAGAGGTTEEVRIPWSALAASGAAPAGLTLAADLVWPGVSTAFLRELPTAVRHDNTHLTACFLSSPGKVFGRDAYLGDPNDWGALKFVAGAHVNATQTSALATGATETYVSGVQAPPAVDGRLSGWKASQFQTVAYAPGLLGDRYSARIAASWDAGFLYVAAHFHAPGGPLNTQPEATQAGYAGGDCLQIRLNDGTHTVNLCGWYDTSDRKAALTADGNDLKDPYLLKQGAKEAFREDADGQGYVQVLAVPWRVLPSGAAPKAGDAWKATFQVWWAGLTPQFTALAQATLAAGGGIPYAYRLASEANVTLAVFDAQGHLVRSLVKDGHRRAGVNTEYWDGKDQFGKAVAPGKYGIKGLDHPPISVSPVVSVGNSGSPPWPTADGTGDWLSDEAAPQAAVTDGTNVYLAAPGSEKGYSIIAVGPDGKRLWGDQESYYPRCVSLTLSGQYLYALYSGPESIHAAPGSPDKDERAFLVCLDKTTGAAAQFSTQRNDTTVTTWPYVDRVAGLWDMRTDKTFTPADYEGQTRYFANDVGEPTDAVGLAAVGGRLYVSMLTQNRILVLDGATAKPIDTIPVPSPVGLRALPDGRILAVSSGKVVTIDPAAKTVTATVIAHDLVAPHDVTTDKSGNVYVSDWATSFQVKEFSPSGTLLRSFGKPGGRPWIGAWDPSGMLLPRGMAVTDDGKLWVAEDDASPNRVSVWDAASGAFVRDYVGPAPYGGGSIFWTDPQDSSTMLAEGTLFHVDYARKTWAPVGTPFRRLSGAAPFTPNGMYGGEPGSRTLVHDGKQYVFCSTDTYEMEVLRRDGDRLTPVAAVGCRGRYITRDGTQKRIWDSDIGSHDIGGYYPDFFQGHAGDNFVWIDKNGDGKVQPDEMQWAHTLSRSDKYVPGLLPEIIAGWGFGFGPDGAIYLSGFCGDRNVVSRLGLEGWTPGGAPTYTLAAAQPLLVTPSDEGVQGLFVDDHNDVVVTRPYEGSGSKHALDVYDQSGKLLWGFAAPHGRQQADDFLADNVIAEFHEPGGEDILASWLWHGNFKPYLFTADGLYVGALLDDTKLGPTATWDESYKDYFQAPDGAAYIVNGANDAYHIDRIVGLERLHRFTGALTVTASELQAAAAASAQAANAPPVAPPPVIRVAWRTTVPAIDGVLDDWDLSGAVTLAGSKGRTARVALARDAANLYLAYDVHGAKLVNKGGNWQTLFISGDCDDLMLHVGAFKPHFAPAEGDERLLLSVYQGKPVAVLYRPIVPGTASSTRLMAAAIDQIVRLPDAKIAYHRAGDGYTLEASVPLSDLGIGAALPDPSAGTTLRGDVGVIYADETGADRSLRLYYNNHETDMAADLTTEATLQPGNWGDVEFPLGPNLLKNGDFEEPLAATPDLGWAITNTRGGGAGAIAEGLGYSGGHALLLRQTTPVTFAPASYALPDYGAFIASANGGNGGGYAEVCQAVPVTAARKYALRFHVRTLGFPGGENRDLGPKRGYVSLMLWVDWQGAGKSLWALNHQDTTPEWKTLTEARFNNYGPPTPYLAPPGATGAVVKFSLSVNSAQGLPKAYVDDVEFVEVGR